MHNRIGIQVALITLTLIVLLCPRAHACLWDYDTLRDERRGLPGMLEILTGRYERHSDFFYAQREARMRALLEREPDNLAAWDNLAVAVEKQGRFDEAIEIILRKDAIKPGEYTTYANLGTFYLHKGDFENGVTHIRRAIEINPDAHFGREKYQLQVAEYIRDGRPTKADAPFADFLGNTLLMKFEEIVEPDRSLYRGEDLPGAADAIEGIVGMIRFGTGKSPDLYYALGNLLAARGDKHLAWRAYTLAIEDGHPWAEQIDVLRERIAGHIEAFDTTLFERERAAAADWRAKFQAFEDDLVRNGRDPDADASLLEPFYREHGPATAGLGFAIADYLPRNPHARTAIPIGIGAIVVVLLSSHLIRRAIRRRRERVATPPVP